eukprot:930168-Rhodomonas_salina.1
MPRVKCCLSECQAMPVQVKCCATTGQTAISVRVKRYLQYGSKCYASQPAIAYASSSTGVAWKVRRSIAYASTGHGIEAL